MTIAAPAGHANDGVHAILSALTDNAGNVEAVKTAIVRIDTRPPQFTWRAVRPQVLRGTGAVRLRFVVADLSGSVRAAYRIYDAGGVLVVRGGHDPCGRGPARRCRRATPTGGACCRGSTASDPLVDAAGNAKVTHATAFRDYRPVQAKVWRDVTGAGRRVALTFDDGYDKAGWAAILAVLHARGAHATFFINGRYVAGYPTLARRTVAWGNAIGSHTWSHILTTTETRPRSVPRSRATSRPGGRWPAPRRCPTSPTLRRLRRQDAGGGRLTGLRPRDAVERRSHRLQRPRRRRDRRSRAGGVRSGAVFELHLCPRPPPPCRPFSPACTRAAIRR